MMTQEQTTIEPVREIPSSAMTLIQPAAEIEELQKHWQKIQQLKRSILDKSDLQEIQGRTYVKRSGWRKLESAFCISDRIISKEREELPDGGFLWRVESEAFHKATGRTATGLGTCSSTERKFSHPEHDILAIAHTRSKNRAISDLIGLGEISAEELEGEADEPPKNPMPSVTLSQDCTCNHSRSQHFMRDSKSHCIDCIKAGKDVKCSLQLK